MTGSERVTELARMLSGHERSRRPCGMRLSALDEAAAVAESPT